MAKAGKVENLTFYDWSVARWVTSDAHDELDACGRGIYREMLDYCYVQGSVSCDPVVLARRCACTRAELVERWETIERYFYRTSDGKLGNRHADAFRKEYIDFIEHQRANGRLRWKNKTATAKQPLSDEIATAEPPLSHQIAYTTQHNTTQHNTTPERDAVAAAFHGWFDSYPKPVRKEAAARAWLQLMDSGEISIQTIPDVIAGTDRWRGSKEWAKSDGEYIPDAKTFLVGNEKHGGRLWKEFPPQSEAAPRKSNSGVDANAEWVEPPHWKNFKK